MKLPVAKWRSLPGMRELLDVLDAAGGETRYVGGCVRDTLLKLPVSDVDLATRFDPEEVLRRLRHARIKAVPTGLAHGTITAVLPGGAVEVTTLRRDVSTDGRRATIAYTDDWREDAARRDFTINALSADPASGKIFDYFEGLDDLREKRVRFIGDAFIRIAEDHLRILRFFRFHGRFGGKQIDTEALNACTARANDLMALSRERIADELLKILLLPDPAAAIGLMVERGILRPVLPEIRMEGVARLTALITSEATTGIDGNPIRRLAALLPAEAQEAGAVAARLRLSNKDSKRLVSAAARDAQTPDDPAILAYRIGKDEAIDRLLLEGDESAKNLLEWERPRLAISGGDLIGMGLKPGPAVAETLRAIEREWMENGFSEDQATQRKLAERFVNQTLRDSQ